MQKPNNVRYKNTKYTTTQKDKKTVCTITCTVQPA